MRILTTRTEDALIKANLSHAVVSYTDGCMTTCVDHRDTFSASPRPSNCYDHMSSYEQEVAPSHVNRHAGFLTFTQMVSLVS